MTDWKPGDRVSVRLPDRNGITRRGGWVRFTGTVRQVDEPGLPRGVRVDLDCPVNGVSDCYATHAELVRELRRELGVEHLRQNHAVYGCETT